MTKERALLHDQEFMQAFLDLVIPPSGDGKMPGAGALGLSSEIATALEADGRFRPAVEAGLEAVRDAAREREPDGFLALPPELRLEVLESQLRAHPGLMPGVTRHLYLAYYQHPKVLEGLGQPPRPPYPEGFEVEETDPELLEKLRARGRPKP